MVYVVWQVSFSLSFMQKEPSASVKYQEEMINNLYGNEYKHVIMIELVSFVSGSRQVCYVQRKEHLGYLFFIRKLIRKSERWFDKYLQHPNILTTFSYIHTFSQYQAILLVNTKPFYLVYSWFYFSDVGQFKRTASQKPLIF